MTWQSALYATEVLRHPGTLNAFINLQEGLDAYQEKRDLPPWIRNFVRLWSDAAGYAIFLNPVATLATFLTFRDASGLGDEGFFAQVKDAVFLNPLLEAAAEYTGLWDDGLLTDPTALRTIIRPAIAVVNAARAKDLIPGDSPIWADPIAYVQQDLKQWISGIMENRVGGPFKQRPAIDPGGHNRDKFFYVMVGQAMEDGATYPEAVEQAEAALVDEESELYQEAFEVYATQGLTMEGMRLAGPFYVREQVPVREQTAEASAVIRGNEPPSPTITYPGTTLPIQPEPVEGSPNATYNDAIYTARDTATTTEDAAPMI
jgi:hypothetical protein